MYEVFWGGTIWGGGDTIAVFFGGVRKSMKTCTTSIPKNIMYSHTVYRVRELQDMSLLSTLPL